jgi:hypothetical protein
MPEKWLFRFNASTLITYLSGLFYKKCWTHRKEGELMEQNEEKNDDVEEQSADEEFEEGSGMQWLKDNLRIIVSVLIVVIIAVGIYSYSNRSEAPTTEKETAASDILSQISGTDEEKTTAEGVTAQEEKKAEEKVPAQKVETKEVQTQEKTSSVSTSQETENSFMETAGRGDSQTKLARRALANYLEKNPDSSLTAEHKIYIEDYLRKHSENKGKVKIGTSVEFSKTLIQDAITKSKNLNDKQLQNLHKYAVRVPSLS